MKEAIVLAAGRGERMMPLTKDSPKPLMPIHGKPMMEYVVDLLAAHGICHVGVNLFYQADAIKRHFGNGERFGVKMLYVRECELTGTAGGAKKVAEKMGIKEPFFVISSDIMVNFDLTDIYSFHQQHGGIATICCYWRSREQLQFKKSGLVLFDANTKQVVQFIERPKGEEDIVSQWVNSSVYVLSPEILDLIPNEIEGSKIVDLPKHVFPALLDRGVKLYTYPVDASRYYQLGVDTPDRVKRVEQDITNGIFVLSFRR